MKNLIINIFKTFFFFDLSLIVIHALPAAMGENEAMTALKNAAIPFAVVLALTLIFTLAVEKRKLKIPLKKPFTSFFKGVLFGAFLPVVCVAAAAVLKGFEITAVNKPENLVLWIVALLITCIMTELLLRGYLFVLYKKYHGFTVATVVTTLLFAALDITLFSHSKIYIANVLLFNILLCFILEYTNSIIATITTHFTFSVLNTVLLGCIYPQSGYPAVVASAFRGNRLLNGGEYGIQGSILCLLLLGIITALLVYKKYRITENAKRLIKFIKRIFHKA